MKKIIGANHSNGSYTKDYNINQDSFQNCWNRERKLMIASKIRNHMRSLYLELFNHLSYKYLVEKEGRKKQNDGQNVETKLYISEEIMYKSYALYLYYLRLLKEESFNPEVDLRVKLFCDCTKTNSVNYKRKSFCPCIYGLKKDQIISLVKSLNTKEERISDHIKKVCTLSHDKKIFQVDYEFYPNLRKEFKEINDKELLKKILEIALGFQIEFNIKDEDS